jgi:GrpB-like predicted nucleotidyltransferase (UPF0157 family)
MHFLAPEALHAVATASFEQERARIGRALPGAVVEHIGATAIAGAWSKGDIDLLVRVPAVRFADAVAALRSLYAPHQLENWSATFASFVLPGAAVGAQLVASGGPEDTEFLRFRERLSSEPALLAEYNDLKRSHEGGSEEEYRAAKGAFVRRVVG